MSRAWCQPGSQPARTGGAGGQAPAPSALPGVGFSCPALLTGDRFLGRSQGCLHMVCSQTWVSSRSSHLCLEILTPGPGLGDRPNGALSQWTWDHLSSSAVGIQTRKMEMKPGFLCLKASPVYLHAPIFTLSFYSPCLKVSHFSPFKKHVYFYLAAPGLSRRIWELVPWPRIKPKPPALGAWSLNHWTAREVPLLSFFHIYICCCSVTKSCPTLRPHGLQHCSPPCPSPSPRVCSNSCPLSQWCHPTISSSVTPFSSLVSIFPSIRVFSNESVLRIRWPKYWSFSFSISPSNEYSTLISFSMDWFDLLAVPGTLW